LKGEIKMRQVCYICGVLYGIKEPYEDDSETHGLCDECFSLEIKKNDEKIKDEDVFPIEIPEEYK